MVETVRLVVEGPLVQMGVNLNIMEVMDIVAVMAEPVEPVEPEPEPESVRQVE